MCNVVGGMECTGTSVPGPRLHREMIDMGIYWKHYLVLQTQHEESRTWSY